MYYLFLAVVLIGTIISFSAVIIVFRESPSSNQKLLQMTTMACFITILCYLFEVTSTNQEAMLICAKIEYIGKSVAMYTYLLFIGNYCKLSLPQWVYRLIKYILTLLVVCVVTSPLHQLYYKSIQIGYDGWFPYFKGEAGSMYLLFMFLMNAIILCYSIMLIIRLCNCPSGEKKKLWILLMSGVLPSAAFLIVIVFGWTFIDMVPLGYAVSCGIIVLLIKKYGLLDTLQVARENIMENTREGLIVVDAAFDVLYANTAVLKMYPQIYSIKDKIQKDKFREIFLEPESVHQVGNLHIEIRISKLYDNNQFKGYLAWIFNMTFIDKYTNQILELKLEAERANMAKSAFLANMSHEIRTPMNAILGFAELIFKKARSREIIEYAYDIRRSSQNLLHIINGILDISKIESGKKEMISEVYYTQSLISDVMVLVSNQAKEKGLKLQRSVDENLPFQIEGDCFAIKEILINVLGNAIKYTEAGTVELTVDCMEEKEDILQVRFCISDTGHGMKEEDLTRIFDKFTRFEKNENYQIEGTGLGMAITKGLVDMLNGTLDISSVYGEGTRVTIVIPQKTIGGRKLGVSQNEELVEYETKKQQDFYADALILVVDDNEMNLRIVSGLLKEYGINADTAQDGYEALAKVKLYKYDLIFMDHMMPGMDGVETMKQIRAMGRSFLTLPIVALTANAILGVREEMIQVGFNDYLSKPLDIQALEKVLMKQLPEDCVTVMERVRDEIDLDRLYAVQEILAHVDVREGIRYCGGTLSQYEDILKMTFERGNDRIESLWKLLEQEDYQAFVIKVHALKSSAASIGAKDTAALAEKMEEEGKQGNYEFLKQSMSMLSALYKIILLEIELLFSKHAEELIDSQQEEEPEHISMEMLQEFLSDIEKLLTDYEFDRAEEVLIGLLELTEGDDKKQLKRILSEIHSLDKEQALESIGAMKRE